VKPEEQKVSLMPFNSRFLTRRRMSLRDEHELNADFGGEDRNYDITNILRHSLAS
jgi:hypothetical protein